MVKSAVSVAMTARTATFPFYGRFHSVASRGNEPASGLLTESLEFIIRTSNRGHPDVLNPTRDVDCELRAIFRSCTPEGVKLWPIRESRHPMDRYRQVFLFEWTTPDSKQDKEHRPLEPPHRSLKSSSGYPTRGLYHK